MGIQTVVLKIYKPGKAKREIMEKALKDYCSALRFLAGKVNGQSEEFWNRFCVPNGGYSPQTLSKWLDPAAMQELDRYDVQPFKDSLRIEFGIMAANWLRTAGTAERSSVREMTVSDHQPVYFCRYDTKRNFCLLYDREKDRYFAKLYLMNADHARSICGANNAAGSRSTAAGARNTAAGAWNTADGFHGEDKLVYIHKAAAALKRTGRRETYLVVPLSFGKWQETILREASRKPERFRTARLYKKQNDFYLAVSIETEPAEPVKTETYLGVSRGLKNKLNFTITDLKGDVLEQGPVDSSGCPGDNCVTLAELHSAANRIHETAKRYKSQVILQNLSVGDRLNWLEDQGETYRPRFGRKEYNQFLKLLDYKLEWSGLPKLLKVSSRGIFHTCPACGRNTARNRISRDFFICTDCGTAMELERLGSLNLARRLIRYASEKVRITLVKTDGGILFSNKLLGLELFLHYGENHQERLMEEIGKIIRAGSTNGIQAGLVKKLTSATDFMDMIEYI